MSHLHIIQVEDKEFIFEDDTISGALLFSELFNQRKSKFCIEQCKVWHCYDFEYGISVVVDSFEKDIFRDDYVFKCHLLYPHMANRLSTFAKRHNY